MKMDDYIPVTILDPVLPEVIEHAMMMERVFRKASIETGVPINELVFEKNYQRYS
jgi:hypothetical protein